MENLGLEESRVAVNKKTVEIGRISRSVLEITNLHKSFDGLKAVEGFSLSLESGKITSLIGPNGAGKTTVFNIVTGFLTPNSGTITFEQGRLTGLSPFGIARRGMARTFQNLRLFRKMTVLDNLLLSHQNQPGENFLNALFAYSDSSPENKRRLGKSLSLLEFVGLAEYRHELADNLSYGQQKLLTIACCLAMEPKLLMLDEPVSGVQPIMIEKITNILKELVEKEKKSVFLIEHDMDFVLRISDNVVVMDDGKKITEGTPEVVKNNPEILEAYLS